MTDLTTPLLVAFGFVGVGWLIFYAGEQYADAVRHTLSIFVLVLALLVTAGVTAKLRAAMSVGRMSDRVEARSQVDRPPPVRKP